MSQVRDAPDELMHEGLVPSRPRRKARMAEATRVRGKAVGWQCWRLRASQAAVQKPGRMVTISIL